MSKLIDNTRQLISGDEDSNTSGNEHFQNVLQARLSRRDVLRGSLGVGMATMFGSFGLSACTSDDNNDDNAAAGSGEKLLNFSAVNKSVLDQVIVPAPLRLHSRTTVPMAISKTVPVTITTAWNISACRLTANRLPPATTAPCWA